MFNGIQNKINDNLIFLLNENYKEFQPEQKENKKLINIEKNLQEKKFKLDFLKKENIRLNKEYKKLLKENNNIKYNKKIDEKDN